MFEENGKVKLKYVGDDMVLITGISEASLTEKFGEEEEGIFSIFSFDTKTRSGSQLRKSISLNMCLWKLFTDVG